MSNAAYTTEKTDKINLKPSRQAIRRAALALALILGVAAAGDFGYNYLTTGRYLETTDDAYVKADSTVIAPKVSGYIAKVLVGDNEKVRAGQVLARIDDRDFRPHWARPARMSQPRKPRCATSMPSSNCNSLSSSRAPPTLPPQMPI